MDPTPEEITRVREFLKRQESTALSDEYARRRQVVAEYHNNAGRLFDQSDSVKFGGGIVDHDGEWRSLQLLLDDNVSVTIQGKFKLEAIVSMARTEIT